MYAASRSLPAAAACAAALALVPATHAAGPPLPTADSGRAGVVAPGGSERLITRRAGRDTEVTAVRRSDGAVLRARRVRGRWSIPAVTLDGANTGLSADGRTLVLARPTSAFPPAATRLAVLDARELVVRRQIALEGFFTVDAVAPDGATAYLLHYPGENVLDYRVRALDTRSGRLPARDIVDPREPEEQMGGIPMTRAMSHDGRWAYTLYGGGHETFIHALDTVGRTAACIDLEMLPPESDLGGVRLRVSPDGRRVDVRATDRLVATVDARTFAVRQPGDPAPAPRAAVTPPADDGGGFPWAVLLPAAAAAAVALVMARRRRVISR
jgi:hypothetical protein